MEAMKENVSPVHPLPLESLGDGTPDLLHYKKLYHASVERYAHLQEQLRKYSSLLSKHRRVVELKDKALSGLARNKELLDVRLLQSKEQYQKELENFSLREEALKKENAQLRSQYRDKCHQLERLCGVLVARGALARAESRVKDTVIENVTSRKELEMERVKKKLVGHSRFLKHKYDEVKESLEFSEAERSVLVEANAEAEALARSLRAELQEKNKMLEQTRSELEERTADLEKARSSKCVHLPPLSMPDIPPSSCTTCQHLSQQLGVALAALSNSKSTHYGHLLHEKFAVEQKLRALEGKFSAGVQDYQKLVAYIEEYKARSTEKVTILKENLQKADQEIAELDMILNMVREAMHSSIHLVRQSPALQKVLMELDGSK